MSAKIWRTTWPAANHEPTNNTKERYEGTLKTKILQQLFIAHAIRASFYMSRSNPRWRQHNVSLIFNTDNFINSLNWQWPLFREFSKATWRQVKESNRELNRKISNTNRWRHGCFQKSCANFANMKRARYFMPFLNLEDFAKSQITQVQNSMPFLYIK